MLLAVTSCIAVIKFLLVTIATPVNESSSSGGVSIDNHFGLLEEVSFCLSLSLSLPPLSPSFSLTHSFTHSHSQAIGGFLIVLDSKANIIYVSETISHYIGLNQVSNRE